MSQKSFFMVLLRNDKNVPKQLKKVDEPATPLAAIMAAGFTTYQIHRKKVAKPVDKDK